VKFSLLTKAEDIVLPYFSRVKIWKTWSIPPVFKTISREKGLDAAAETLYDVIRYNL